MELSPEVRLLGMERADHASCRSLTALTILFIVRMNQSTGVSGQPYLLSAVDLLCDFPWICTILVLLIHLYIFFLIVDILYTNIRSLLAWSSLRSLEIGETSRGIQISWDSDRDTWVRMQHHPVGSSVKNRQAGCPETFRSGVGWREWREDKWRWQSHRRVNWASDEDCHVWCI